jgi:hypothetical protein
MPNAGATLLMHTCIHVMLALIDFISDDKMSKATGTKDNLNIWHP